MYKALVFDIGGVVTFTDFHALYANFANRVGISTDFIEHYHKLNFNDLLIGKIDKTQFFADMRNAGSEKDLDLPAIWIEEALKIRQVNTELLKVIDKLRQNYITGVLTNLTPSRYIVDEATGIYTHFDFVVLSCEERLKKPDPNFYQLVFTKAEVKPQEIVFVDDKEGHVAIAKNLGWQGIVYADNQQLFKELIASGIQL